MMNKRIRYLCTVLLLFLGLSAFAGGQQSSERNEIVFWHSYSQQERIDAIDKSIAVFEQENPGYTVRQEVVPWGAMYERWVAAHEAGTLPDISAVLLNQALLMAEAGAIDSVDDLVQTMGGPGAFLEKPLQNLYYDGRYIGVPHYAHARLLWYRPDWLKEAGLAVPTNLQELEAVARALHNPPSRFGFVTPLGPAGPAGIYFYHYLLAYGGMVFDADGNVAINSPEARQAIDYMLRLYRTVSPEGSINYDTSEVKSAFIAERTPFIIEAPFIIADVMRDADWASPQRLAGIPVPGAVDQPWMAELIAIVRHRDLAHPEATMKFVELLFRESEYVSFLHAVPGGQLPTVSAVANGQEFWQHQVIRDYRSSIENAILGIAGGTPVAMSEGPNLWAAVVYGERVIERMLQEIATGEKTVDRALRDLETRLQQIVREN